MAKKQHAGSTNKRQRVVQQPQPNLDDADLIQSKKHVKQNGAAADITKLAEEAAAKAARYHARMAAAATAATSQERGATAALVDDIIADGDDGVDSDDDSDETEDEQLGGEEQGTAAAQKQHIYNTDALHEKLEDIAWVEEQPWEESLAITAAQPTHVADVDDDLDRELAFYNQVTEAHCCLAAHDDHGGDYQALSATVEAINRFQSAGTPWLRPPDYYAEMVKSDTQMAKIKDKLMYEQQQIDQAAERRKAREAKAYAKQVQAEKQKERAQDKKRQIQQVQQLRKQREKSGFAGELDFDAEMNKQQQRQQGGLRAGVRIQQGKTPNKKRRMKDAKFGFGGRKRLQKQNDAFSAADMSGYKPGRFDDGVGGKKGGGKQRGPNVQGGVKKGGKVKGGNRPGKARRHAMKQRKH